MNKTTTNYRLRVYGCCLWLQQIGIFDPCSCGMLCISTSFWVRAAPESWSKYTTVVLKKEAIVLSVIQHFLVFKVQQLIL